MKFERAMVIGASSGMGAEISRQLAAGGCKVAMVARRAGTLTQMADNMGAKTLIYGHDVRCADEVPALFQQICRDLGGLDVIFYAAGVMPRIAPDEYSFAKDEEMVAVNLLGGIAWLNEAAQRFRAAGGGTIVGISSVAGDRGRQGQPVYCASKAAFDTYLEGLRNRVGRYGVSVVTIKPGPVDTPMTKGLDKLPMLLPVDKAAAQIIAAAQRGVRIAYVPKQWRPIMFVIRSIPSFLFKKMNI